MRIVTVTPYASFNPEAGLIYLLANYLRAWVPEIMQLRCNGIYSLCDRDSERSWKRTPHTCFQCIADSQALAGWSGIPHEDLSKFLLPDDVESTRRWFLQLTTADLPNLEFQGTSVFALCQDSFMNRFGMPQPDWGNRNHEQYARRLMLSTVRACIAFSRFNNRVKPDLALLAGGNDFMGRAFLHQGKLQHREVSLFQWDLSGRATQVLHPRTGKSFKCELLLQDVIRMRNDVKSWSRELLQLLDGVLAFLDIPLDQMPLPIAK